jgi:hypothetical protein
MAEPSSVRTPLAIICAFLLGITVFILLAMNLLPSIYIYILFPFLAYGFSILFSVIHQYTSCGKINISAISKSNSFILLTNFIVSLVLYLESIPWMKYIFGEYPPLNPFTGIAYEPNSPEYLKEIQTQDYLKIQPFSSTVKGVLPAVLEENTKTGLVGLYWYFWATLLPHYFTLSIQENC